MTIILVVICLLSALVGLLSLSNATLGVGLIAAACLVGILARIAQASEHHAALMAVANPGSVTPSFPMRPTPTWQKAAWVCVFALLTAGALVMAYIRGEL